MALPLVLLERLHGDGIIAHSSWFFFLIIVTLGQRELVFSVTLTVVAQVVIRNKLLRCVFITAVRFGFWVCSSTQRLLTFDLLFKTDSDWRSSCYSLVGTLTLYGS